MTDQTERPLADVIEKLWGLAAEARLAMEQPDITVSARWMYAETNFRDALRNHADLLLSAASRVSAPAFDPKCRHGCRQAVGLYLLPQGCPCFDDKEQWLCDQHLVKLRNNDYEAIPIFERPLAASAPGVEGWLRTELECCREALRPFTELLAVSHGSGENVTVLQQAFPAKYIEAAELAASPSPRSPSTDADSGPTVQARHSDGRRVGHSKLTAANLADAMAGRRPSPDAGVEALREAFRCVDDQDWEYLLGRLDWSDRDKFWRAVIKEVREALSPIATNAKDEANG